MPSNITLPYTLSNGATADADQVQDNLDSIVTEYNTSVGGLTGDLITTSNTKTMTNKTLTSPVINTGISGTAIVDEDTMTSNSDTKVPTQQSVKAYVDTSVAGVTVPVKATSAEIDTATDDAKFATALAIAGSTLMKFSATRFKVGSFTRAQDGADGAVAYTGVGFQPKAVVFLAGIDVTPGSSTPSGGSVGFDDGTNPFCKIWATNGASNMRSTSSIQTRDNNSWEEAGKITTLGSDGFTITWSKAGSPPSATITVYYLAFR